MHIEKFQIDVCDAVLADLKNRLQKTRWNDAVSETWDYGTEKGFLQSLISKWIADYDWRTREATLNRLPHFRATIDGKAIHFLHFKGRGLSPKPLLLMNGWPSSFIEYQKLAPLLADPELAGGDSRDAFDVVIPAHPGFGFSSRPQQPGEALLGVELFHELMVDGLGFKQFFTAGTDIGAGIATRLGLAYPESVLAIHITSVANPTLGPNSRPLNDAEKAYRESYGRWLNEEGGYFSIQSTRPQTLAFGLADSPVGLASWITEKFRNWSDCGGDVLSVFPADMLLDNLMVYWITETIGSSVRYYYEGAQYRRPFEVDEFMQVPTAILMLGKDLMTAPREWAERFYNVKRYSVLPRGGHFPAWEMPMEYASDLQTFFRAFRH